MTKESYVTKQQFIISGVSGTTEGLKCLCENLRNIFIKRIIIPSSVRVFFGLNNYKFLHKKCPWSYSRVQEILLSNGNAAGR